MASKKRRSGRGKGPRQGISGRYLLVAPFGYDGEGVDHWYAWDIDSCWLLNVVEAGVFGSAQDALSEWQHAVGPPPGRNRRQPRPR